MHGLFVLHDLGLVPVQPLDPQPQGRRHARVPRGEVALGPARAGHLPAHLRPVILQDLAGEQRLQMGAHGRALELDQAVAPDEAVSTASRDWPCC